MRYTYEEEHAAGVVAAVVARLEKEKAAGKTPANAVPTLTTEGAEGGEVDVSDGSTPAAKVDPSSIGMLQIADGDGEDAGDATAPAAPAAPAAEVKLVAGSAAALSATANGKVCAITGKPAKYRDPISGLPYADLAAFKELRKLHPDPNAAQKEAAAAEAAEAAEAAAAKKAPSKVVAVDGDGDGDGDGEDTIQTLAPIPSERPIQLGENFVRRVNKVA